MTNLTLEVTSNGLQVSNGTKTMTFWNRPFSHSHESYWTIRVNGSFETSQGEGPPSAINGEYGDVFFLYMSAYHDEVWASLGAFYTGVDQYVILNATYDPLLVLTLDRGRMIS